MTARFPMAFVTFGDFSCPPGTTGCGVVDAVNSVPAPTGNDRERRVTTMIPTPKVFRSRWSALFWAAGIVWMAVDIADSAPHTGTGTGSKPGLVDADGDAINAADLAAVANIAGL